MRERSSEIRRNAIRLVVVNDEPPREASQTAVPKGERGGVDPRVFDLVAVLFTISLAFLLAYVFNSLNHADKVLYCLVAGGTVCN